MERHGIDEQAAFAMLRDEARPTSEGEWVPGKRCCAEPPDASQPPTSTAVG